MSRAGILVTKYLLKKQLLKDALLLKFLSRTNDKELGKTQNTKVVDNFKKFPMVQSPPNYELRAKGYSQNMKYFRNLFTFCKIGYTIEEGRMLSMV